MGAVTITVTSNQSFRGQVRSAFAGKRQDEQISLESFDLLWKVLAHRLNQAGDRKTVVAKICQAE
jgi:hypothetical protein